VLSDGGTTLTVSPTEPVVYSNGASNFVEAVTITNASGITDIDTSVEWNPDKEPINQDRDDLF